jgi:hypothetical protein
MGMLGEVHAAVRQIDAVRAQLATLAPRLADAADLRQAVEETDRHADEILNVLFEPKAKAGVDLLNYPMRLNVRIAYLEDEIDFGDGAPTAQFREMAAEYRTALDRELGRWKTLLQTDVPALNGLLAKRGLPAIAAQ